MKFSKNLLILCITAMMTACLGCQGGSVTKSSSPEDAFNNLKSAADKKDWSAFCGCLTPDSLDGMAGGMALVASMMEIAADMPMMGPEVEKLKALAGQFKSTMEKFGVTKEVVGDVSPALMGDTGALRKIGAQIKNQPGFIGAVMGLLDKTSEVNGGGTPGSLDFEGASLSDVKIDGDTATGMINSEGGGMKEGEIRFEKIDGNWLIDFDLNG